MNITNCIYYVPCTSIQVYLQISRLFQRQENGNGDNPGNFKEQKTKSIMIALNNIQKLPVALKGAYTKIPVVPTEISPNSH